MRSSSFSRSGFIVLFALIALPASADLLSNQLYEAVFDGDFRFELHPDQEAHPQSGVTRGIVTYSVTNKTAIPLRVSGIEVEHTCAKTPYPTFENPQTRSYQFASDGTRKLAPGGSVSHQYELEGGATVCSGNGGGVTATRIVAVVFSQAKFTAAEQIIRCGDRDVPVAMGMVGAGKAFQYYTSHGIVTYTRDKQQTATAESLFRDLCGLKAGATADPSTLNLLRSKFMEYARLWIEACEAKPDKCEEGYRIWSSDGVRG